MLQYITVYISESA